MIQRKIARLGLAALGLTIGASLLTIDEASAKGCNGVVNPAVWGCAPWDNNNGPKFPNYKAPASAASKPPAVAKAPPQAM